MNEISKITVIIVDDHAVVRQGIQAFLETNADIQVVGVADRGPDAVKLAKVHTPQVALVDMVMPGMDGVEVTRQIRGVSPNTQVIVFTSFHANEYVFPALRAGALSYLLKDCRPEEIADAIRKAVRGEAVLDSRVAARIVHDMQGVNDDPVNAFQVLSDRELEVLRLVAIGISNHAIAERLVIGESTVKTHVGNILSKLSLSDRTQAAVFAWATGIVHKENL
jgi:NarL family two-component system response regulator LiaR